MRFDRAGLEEAGFVGWVPFCDLPSAEVPHQPGIYVVVRTNDAPPQWLASSPAGPHKGRAPSVSTDRLATKWVSGTAVLYIGKATDLFDRLDAYRRHGLGQAAGHWGGRFIWQCDDAPTALVGWRRSESDPEDDESDLLVAFVATHGALPFANLKRGRRKRS